MNRFLVLYLSLVSSCGPLLNVDKEVSKPNDYTATAAVQPADNDKTLKIVIFDVGQGDSALIVLPNNSAVLLDSGPPGAWKSTVEPFIKQNGINLERLFISHSDIDHNGSTQDINISPKDVLAGDVILLSGGVELNILAKDCAFADGTSVECEADDNNAKSMVLLLKYGDFTYLTTGDLPGGGGEPPYDTIDLETKVGELAGDVDVLHVGHHGSTTSTNQNLLNSTTPETAVISVGDGNDYWHPHPSVMERLISSGINVYQTERGWLKDKFLNSVHIAGGNILIESDGADYNVEY